MHKTPHGWPFRQLNVPQAHRITRGSPDVVVAVIDLGYNFHPDHEGHLWADPTPKKGAVHGWDFFDGDETLEPSGPDADTDYYRDHHCFVAGEVMACAPECKVMIVRVGYGKNPDCWWQAIDYATEHGAKVMVIPHGFLSHGSKRNKTPLFYRGSDFSYPLDNPQIKRALDDAYEAGCLICRGTCDNRGRRVASAYAAVESVIAIGSTNQRGQAADIAASADYVEVATPGGQRDSKDETDFVWSTGGANNYVSSTGGCMAAGFGGGVTALVWSQFPELTNEQIRQVLRNTAVGDGWDHELGWGILDAATAVRLKPNALKQDLRIDISSASLKTVRRKPVLSVEVANRGAFDVESAMLVAFNGDPRKPGAPKATMKKPEILVTHQIGHALAPVRGLHSSTFDVALTEKPPKEIWLQVCALDLGAPPEAETVQVLP